MQINIKINAGPNPDPLKIEQLFHWVVLIERDATKGAPAFLRPAPVHAQYDNAGPGTADAQQGAAATGSDANIGQHADGMGDGGEAQMTQQQAADAPTGALPPGVADAPAPTGPKRRGGRISNAQKAADAAAAAGAAAPAPLAVPPAQQQQPAPSPAAPAIPPGFSMPPQGLPNGQAGAPAAAAVTMPPQMQQPAPQTHAAMQPVQPAAPAPQPQQPAMPPVQPIPPVATGEMSLDEFRAAYQAINGEKPALMFNVMKSFDPPYYSLTAVQPQHRMAIIMAAQERMANA